MYFTVMYKTTVNLHTTVQCLSTRYFQPHTPHIVVEGDRSEMKDPRSGIACLWLVNNVRTLIWLVRSWAKEELRPGSLREEQQLQTQGREQVRHRNIVSCHVMSCETPQHCVMWQVIVERPSDVQIWMLDNHSSIWLLSLIRLSS